MATSFSEKDSEGLKLKKFNHLPQMLKAERDRIEHLSKENEDLAFKLTRETHNYLNVSHIPGSSVSAGFC